MIIFSISKIIIAKYFKNDFGTRALMYHRFGYKDKDPFCITPENFRKQMKWISENMTALSIQDIEQFFSGEIKSLPKNSVVITIDDGFLCALEIAQPILKEFNLPAILFVSSGIFDNTVKYNSDLGKYLSIEQLKIISKNGMTIGSHGYSHRFMKNMSDQELEIEIESSKKFLEKAINKKITSFAYPYGTKAAFDKRTRIKLKENQYFTAFTTQHGVIKKSSNPLEIPRIKIESGENLFYFKLICYGGMDNWRIIDNFLSKIQKPIY